MNILRNFINRKGFWVIAAAVIIALIAAVSVALGSSGSDLANSFTNTLMKPVKSVMSSFVDNLEDYYNYMYKYDELEEENERLKAHVAELEEEYREYTDISEENSRLRSLLSLSERHSDYKFETANIISWTASNHSSSFIINKGTSAGLELYQGVVTENGYLVGQITQIDSSSATVTTILDSTSSIGAIINETGETAIVNGDFTLFQDGLVKLSYLQHDTRVSSGNTIITSGKGGVYPQGLVIGHVGDVVNSPSGLDVYATVTPAAEIKDLTHIFVITDFSISQ